MNCRNCAAPLRAKLCSYCGSFNVDHGLLPDTDPDLPPVRQVKMTALGLGWVDVVVTAAAAGLALHTIKKS